MNHSPAQTPAKQTSAHDNYDKGYAFENYIRQLFNEKYFELKKWRKAQKSLAKDLLPEYSKPDLELIFGRNKYRFAVECKWRNEFKNGMIHWAEDEQICRYMDFQYQQAMPVFIAIGVGGDPSNPDKLFVTPLDNISMYTHVYESYLIPFERIPTHRFFYDTIQLKLF